MREDLLLPSGRSPLVLHVTQPVTGGVAQCVADLVAEQRAAGWQALVACPPPPAGSPLAGLDTLPWDATRSPGPSVPREVLALRRLVGAARPDLVHLHSSKAGLAGRLALRGRVPTVFAPHAWSFQAVEGRVRSASLAWEQYAVRWADRVLCVSRAEERDAEAAGVRARTAVLVNGVPLEPEVPAGEARARLGLDDAPTVLCVGRLARQKGQDVLLRAWADVRAEVPAARLLLVGDGPEEAALRARTAPGWGVSFLGARSDTALLYSAADVVAVPSRWEAMALVVLEAMAAGRSQVATDVGAARECLEPPGAGAVVPVDDDAALAEALVARLRDPLLALVEGARGRGEVERRYDVRRTTAAVRGLYAEVLAERAQRARGLGVVAPVPALGAGPVEEREPLDPQGSAA